MLTNVGSLIAPFLVVTFVLHGIAFSVLGWRRRKIHYFFLTGTFVFLTAIYFIKFEGWLLTVPGTGFLLAWLLRIAAGLCTLAYLWCLKQEEGSWLRRLIAGAARGKLAPAGEVNRAVSRQFAVLPTRGGLLYSMELELRDWCRGGGLLAAVISKGKWVVLVVSVALATAAGYTVWKTLDQGDEFVVSGVIEADDIHVGSKVGGRVMKVTAREGQSVKAGDVLVLLEPQEPKASLAESQASLRQAEARLSELLAGYRREEIDQAKADWLAAKAQHGNAEKLRQRMKDLVERQLIAPQEYDDARAKAEETEQRTTSAKERYDLLLAGTRQEEIAQARAGAEAARARVELLRTQLDETVVRSPVDAVVEVLDLEPGDLVGAGKPVATLLRTGSLWVRAYLPEKRLGHVRPGLTVRIRVDSFPRKDFSGTVRRIHRQAEFTPRNVQTTEERVLQVFQTEVIIDDPERVLRPGMNADVFIRKAEG